MSLDPIAKHYEDSKQRIHCQSNDEILNDAAKIFFSRSHQLQYSYNFSWLGRPIIQYPQDIIALQEIIYEVKPDLIIETGIAHGGSLIFSASLLSLIDLMSGDDPKKSKRKVVGIDIDIRNHNRQALDAHPLRHKIHLIEGSSIDDNIISDVHKFAKPYQNILVCLDSNHTNDHVLAELHAYANLVHKGSYCIVFDTVIDDLPQGSFPDRPWDVGNNPKTAVRTWLKDRTDFEIDHEIDQKLLISVTPNGYLKRIK